jgi:hypothetical protein
MNVVVIVSKKEASTDEYLAILVTARQMEKIQHVAMREKPDKMLFR